VVEYLLIAGADVSIVNNKGQSPRSLAVSHLNEKTQALLRLHEESDLALWKNYRTSNSDGITYGDLGNAKLTLNYLNPKLSQLNPKMYPKTVTT
jgi:ankyrin repeat protein